MANVIIKEYRGKLIYYYTNKGRLFRESSGVVITKNNLNVSGEVKQSFINNHQLVIDRLAYLNKIVDDYILDNKIKPPVDYLKEVLKGNIHRVEKKNKPLIDYYTEFYNDRKREYTLNKDKSITTLKDYKSCFNSLIDYELYYDVVLKPTNVNEEFVREYMYFMREKRVNTNEKQYLTRGGLKNNSLKKRFDSLYSFFRFLQERDLIKHLPKREKLSKPEIEKVVLTKREILDFYNFQHENENYNKVKDIFVFSCYTGFRFSDLKSMESEHYFKRNDFYFIKKRAEKTKKFVNVPLNKVALEIAKKYNFNFKIGSNQNFNRVLKDVAEDSELFNDYLFGKEKYKQLSCHCARHSFINCLINSNIPVGNVMKLTGHEKLETLNVYIEKKEPENNEDVNVLIAF